MENFSNDIRTDKVGQKNVLRQVLVEVILLCFYHIHYNFVGKIKTFSIGYKSVDWFIYLSEIYLLHICHTDIRHSCNCCIIGEMAASVTVVTGLIGY